MVLRQTIRRNGQTQVAYLRVYPGDNWRYTSTIQDVNDQPQVVAYVIFEVLADDVVIPHDVTPPPTDLRLN